MASPPPDPQVEEGEAILKAIQEMSERWDATITPASPTWQRIYTEISNKLNEPNGTIDAVLKEYFRPSPERDLLIPATAPKYLVQMQEDNTKRYMVLIGTRFKGLDIDLPFKLTMAYFGFPVEPLNPELFSCLDEDVTMVDCANLTSYDTRPPLHFLSGHDTRNWGLASLKGSEEEYIYAPVPQEYMVIPTDPPESPKGTKGGGGSPPKSTPRIKVPLPTAISSSDDEDSNPHGTLRGGGESDSNSDSDSDFVSDSDSDSDSDSGSGSGSGSDSDSDNAKNKGKGKDKVKVRFKDNDSDSDQTTGILAKGRRARILDAPDPKDKGIQEASAEGPWLWMCGYQGGYPFVGGNSESLAVAIRALLSLTGKQSQADVVVSRFSVADKQWMEHIDVSLPLRADSKIYKTIRDHTATYNIRDHTDCCAWFVRLKDDPEPPANAFRPGAFDGQWQIVVLQATRAVPGAPREPEAYFALRNDVGPVLAKACGRSSYAMFIRSAMHLLQGGYLSPGDDHTGVAISDGIEVKLADAGTTYGGISTPEKLFSKIYRQSLGRPNDDSGPRNEWQVQIDSLQENEIAFWMPGYEAKQKRDYEVLKVEGDRPYRNAWQAVNVVLARYFSPDRLGTLKPKVAFWGGWQVWNTRKLFDPAEGPAFQLEISVCEKKPEGGIAEPPWAPDIEKMLGDALQNSRERLFVLQPLFKKYLLYGSWNEKPPVEDKEDPAKYPCVEMKRSASMQHFWELIEELVDEKKNPKDEPKTPKDWTKIWVELRSLPSGNQKMTYGSVVVSRSTTGEEFDLLRLHLIGPYISVTLHDNPVIDYSTTLQPPATEWGPRYGLIGLLGCRDRRTVVAPIAPKPQDSEEEEGDADDENEDEEQGDKRFDPDRPKRGGLDPRDYRESLWARQPSFFDGGPQPRVPRGGVPIESLLRVGGPGVPQVSRAVLTPTEQRKLQEAFFNMRNTKLKRIIKCHYDKCEFTCRADQESVMRKHLKKRHVVEKCPWCPVLFPPYWTRERREGHIFKKHAARVTKSETADAKPAGGKDGDVHMQTQEDRDREARGLDAHWVQPIMHPQNPPPPPVKVASRSETNYVFCDRCGREHAKFDHIRDRMVHDAICVPGARAVGLFTWCGACGEKFWETGEAANKFSEGEKFPHRCADDTQIQKFCYKCGFRGDDPKPAAPALNPTAGPVATAAAAVAVPAAAGAEGTEDKPVDYLTKHIAACKGFKGKLGAVCPYCGYQMSAIVDWKIKQTHIAECARHSGVEPIVTPFNLYPAKYYDNKPPGPDPAQDRFYSGWNTGKGYVPPGRDKTIWELTVGTVDKKEPDAGPRTMKKLLEEIQREQGIPPGVILTTKQGYQLLQDWGRKKFPEQWDLTGLSLPVENNRTGPRGGRPRGGDKGDDDSSDGDPGDGGAVDGNPEEQNRQTEEKERKRKEQEERRRKEEEERKRKEEEEEKAREKREEERKKRREMKENVESVSDDETKKTAKRKRRERHAEERAKRVEAEDAREPDVGLKQFKTRFNDLNRDFDESQGYPWTGFPWDRVRYVADDRPVLSCPFDRECGPIDNRSRRLHPMQALMSHALVHHGIDERKPYVDEAGSISLANLDISLSDSPENSDDEGGVDERKERWWLNQRAQHYRRRERSPDWNRVLDPPPKDWEPTEKMRCTRCLRKRAAVNARSDFPTNDTQFRFHGIALHRSCETRYGPGVSVWGSIGLPNRSGWIDDDEFKKIRMTLKAVKDEFRATYPMYSSTVYPATGSSTANSWMLDPNSEPFSTFWTLVWPPFEGHVPQDLATAPALHHRNYDYWTDTSQPRDDGDGDGGGDGGGDGKGGGGGAVAVAAAITVNDMDECNDRSIEVTRGEVGRTGNDVGTETASRNRKRISDEDESEEVGDGESGGDEESGEDEGSGEDEEIESNGVGTVAATIDDVATETTNRKRKRMFAGVMGDKNGPWAETGEVYPEDLERLALRQNLSGSGLLPRDSITVNPEWRPAKRVRFATELADPSATEDLTHAGTVESEYRQHGLQPTNDGRGIC